MTDDTTTSAGRSVSLWRRWKLITVFVVLGVAAGLAIAYAQTPMYSGRATVVVQPAPLQPTLSNASTGVISSAEVETQAAIVSSMPVARLAMKKLSLSGSPHALLNSVTAQASGQTRIITVTARRRSADQAASVANAFASAYLAYRADRADAAVSAAQTSLAAQSTDLRQRIAKISKKLQKAQRGDAATLQAQRQQLQVQLTQVSSQNSTLSDTVTSDDQVGQMLVEATAPRNPFSPKPILNGVLAGIVGLIVGLGLALLLESRAAAAPVPAEQRAASRLRSRSHGSRAQGTASGAESS